MDRARVKCIVRGKWLVLTPEELVRQSVLNYLIEQKAYPRGRFAVEQVVKVNGMNKRADAILYDADGKTQMLIECKRQDVTIDQKTVAQTAMYNKELDAPYLLMSNGRETHLFHIDYGENSIQQLSEIPDFHQL